MTDPTPAQPWLVPAKAPPQSGLTLVKKESNGRPKDGKRGPFLRRDHPVASAFLDETGSISADRFFAVGLLMVNEPAPLLRAVQKVRDRRHWYGEIKFTGIKEADVALYQELIDLVLATAGAGFFCFVADRRIADPVQRFGSQWDAYGKLAEQLVVAAIRPPALVALMADNYSTPDHILFEQDLRAAVNRRLNRLALVSVCRLDSRSSDGLQLVDLLTSATAFEFRAHAGLASKTSPKAQVADYLRSQLGAESCLTGWRNASHSVQVFGKT